MGTQQGRAVRVSGGSPLLMRRAGECYASSGVSGDFAGWGKGNALPVEMGCQARCFFVVEVNCSPAGGFCPGTG